MAAPKAEMKLTIRTPYGTIYDGTVEFVRLRTDLGMLVIKPHHADLVGTAGFTSIRYRKDEDKEQVKFVARHLVMNMSNKNNHLSIFAAHCTKTKELSVTSAKEYLALVEEQLKEGKNMDDFHLKYIKSEKILLEQQIEVMGK